MKIKVEGVNIETMCSTIPYKSNVMHFEGDIQNVSPIRQNRNAYPRKENNCGDVSSMVLLNSENLGNTIISVNIYLSRNNIPEMVHSILSSTKDFETRGLHSSYLPIFLQVLKRFG